MVDLYAQVIFKIDALDEERIQQFGGGGSFPHLAEATTEL